MRAALLVTVALAVAACGGCGGDDGGGEEAGGAATAVPAPTGSDREQIDRTLRAYVQALNAGDGERACALLTKNGKGVLTGVLPSDESDTDCTEVVARVARRWTGLSDYRVADISPAGERATARLISRRPRYDSGVLLQEEGTGWKIAYPPAVHGAPRPPGVPLAQDEGEQ